MTSFQQNAIVMTILDNIEALIFAVDPQTKRIMYANRTCMKMFGPGCAGQPYDNYIPLVLEEPQNNANAEESVILAEQEAHFAATDQWLAFTIDFVPWPDGGHAFLITGFDITTKKFYEESVRNLAYMDHLTGLPNRYRCELDLKETLERRRADHAPAHLLFIDLDDFKIVNDCYGHAAGDGVLVSFAGFLVEFLKEDENKVYRLGGDEFVVILGRSDNGSAQNNMNAMLERAKQPWKSGELGFHCSLSIGAVEFAADDTPSSLLKKADIAMYRAKKAGKNNYAFHRAEFDAESQMRRQIEPLLREAVDNDLQALRVLYQPYSDIATGAVIGAEALMRLAGDGGQLLLPEDFIDLAEYLGLLIPLGERAIRRAAEQSRIIRAGGAADFSMTVNLSEKQFRQRDVIPRIEKILRDTGAEPAGFIVSVREGAVAGDPKRANACLREFRRLGVRTALDEFGSGQMGFLDMRQLEVDIIKFSPAFIRSGGDEFSRHFLRLAVDLSHRAGKTVCVNGVETAEQLALCRELAADQAQGFYLNRPGSGDALARLLAAGAAGAP